MNRGVPGKTLSHLLKTINHIFIETHDLAAQSVDLSLLLGGYLRVKVQPTERLQMTPRGACLSCVWVIWQSVLRPPTLLHTEVNQVLQGHDIEGFTVFNAASVSVIYQCVFVLGEGLAPARQEPNPHNQKAHFSRLRERSTASSARPQYSLSNICRL